MNCSLATLCTLAPSLLCAALAPSLVPAQAGRPLRAHLPALSSDQSDYEPGWFVRNCRTGNLCFDADCSSTGPTGACCLADGSCVEIKAVDCAAMGGFYNGNGSRCMDVDCPQPTGSCCLVDGSCIEDVTEDECTTAGGTYNGDGSLCVDVNCPPAAGACCLADGSCVQDRQDVGIGIGGSA